MATARKTRRNTSSTRIVPLFSGIVEITENEADALIARKRICGEGHKAIPFEVLAKHLGYNLWDKR
jgi:hypothetical protein